MRLRKHFHCCRPDGSGMAKLGTNQPERGCGEGGAKVAGKNLNCINDDRRCGRVGIVAETTRTQYHQVQQQSPGRRRASSRRWASTARRLGVRDSRSAVSRACTHLCLEPLKDAAAEDVELDQAAILADRQQDELLRAAQSELQVADSAAVAPVTAHVNPVTNLGEGGLVGGHRLP